MTPIHLRKSYLGCIYFTISLIQNINSALVKQLNF